MMCGYRLPHLSTRYGPPGFKPQEQIITRCEYHTFECVYMSVPNLVIASSNDPQNQHVDGIIDRLKRGEKD